MNKKVVFTIATRKYLANAYVLVDTFLEVNKEHEAYVLVHGETEGLNPAYNHIGSEQLGISDYEEWCKTMTLLEVCCALKAFGGKYFLDNNAESVLFLDSDIAVYSSFIKTEELLQNFEIVLTPHTNSPYPPDGKHPNEMDILNSGTYNAGFFALKNGEQAKAFVEWWAKNLYSDCRVDTCSGLSADQTWLNHVPVYWSGATAVINDKGYNMAQFNLHERVLESSEDGYLVNGAERLVFFHFTGFHEEQPQILSKHQNRFGFDKRTDLMEIHSEYANKILKHKSSLAGAFLEVDKQELWAIKKRYSPNFFKRVLQKMGVLKA